MKREGRLKKCVLHKGGPRVRVLERPKFWPALRAGGGGSSKITTVLHFISAPPLHPP